jgi:hypothetical protein
MDWVISLLVTNSNRSIAMHKWVFLASFPFFQKQTRKVLSKFLFSTQASFLSTYEGEIQIDDLE